MTSRPGPFPVLAFALLLGLSAGCSGTPAGEQPTAGASGAVSTSGGSSSSGAPATTGGASTGGTTTNTGGVTNTGGTTPSTGGVTTNTGGTTPGTGGASAGATSTTGGASTGGSSGAAGSSAGGATGGSAGSGGSSGAGGAKGGAGGVGTGGTAGSGGTSGGAGGSAGSGGVAGAAILDQTGNPVYDKLNGHTSWLSTAGDAGAKLTEDKTIADNMITWQLSNGGFYKYDKAVYAAPWNGSAAKSDWKGANDVDLGTIDNGATTSQLQFLVDVYKRSNDVKYRDAARKALDFLLLMQTSSGGFPQVYPARTGTSYSNLVTYNDDAMARVLILMDQIVKQKAPFEGELFTSAQRDKITTAITKAVDYILKSQITQGSVKTVWCAQHDPTTYEPKGARSYELASKSGSESVSVVGFLMTQPQTATIKASVQAALTWYRSDTVKVANTAYVKRPSGNTDDTFNPIQTQPGSTMWYRFYDLAQDRGFFSGRLPTDDPPGTGKKYDIMEIEAERRYGYQWGGAYGTKLLTYATKVGY